MTILYTALLTRDDLNTEILFFDSEEALQAFADRMNQVKPKKLLAYGEIDLEDTNFITLADVVEWRLKDETRTDLAR